MHKLSYYPVTIDTWLCGSWCEAPSGKQPIHCAVDIVFTFEGINTLRGRAPAPKGAVRKLQDLGFLHTDEECEEAEYSYAETGDLRNWCSAAADQVIAWNDTKYRETTEELVQDMNLKFKEEGLPVRFFDGDDEELCAKHGYTRGFTPKGYKVWDRDKQSC